MRLGKGCTYTSYRPPRRRHRPASDCRAKTSAQCEGMVAGAKVVVVVDRSVGAPQQQVLQITEKLHLQSQISHVSMQGGAHVYKYEHEAYRASLSFKAGRRSHACPSLRSIDELIASKSLRSVRVGRRRLLRYADLERFSPCGSNRITKRKV